MNTLSIQRPRPSNMTQGMLAPDPGFEQLHAALTLERSLLFALGLLVVGLGLGVAATLGWGRAGFGALSPEHTMRLAIPSATLILLAVSTASMAFFLSFAPRVRRSEEMRGSEALEAVPFVGTAAPEEEVGGGSLSSATAAVLSVVV